MGGWEEANRVPFLIREFSYDRDPSVEGYTLPGTVFTVVVYEIIPETRDT